MQRLYDRRHSYIRKFVTKFVIRTPQKKEPGLPRGFVRAGWDAVQGDGQAAKKVKTTEEEIEGGFWNFRSKVTRYSKKEHEHWNWDCYQ